jgi:predicted GIY-YIG superfamily endonuclease
MLYYVYILRSIPFPKETYIGFTTDIQARLTKHNEGGCLYTTKFKPWHIVFYCIFQHKIRALMFEKYLKSHSGKAFTAKHFL